MFNIPFGVVRNGRVIPFFATRIAYLHPLGAFFQSRTCNLFLVHLRQSLILPQYTP
jgi:hypothetical protein